MMLGSPPCHRVICGSGTNSGGLSINTESDSSMSIGEMCKNVRGL